jgi:hypothetical protein
VERDVCHEVESPDCAGDGGEPGDSGREEHVIIVHIDCRDGRRDQLLPSASVDAEQFSQNVIVPTTSRTVQKKTHAGPTRSVSLVSALSKRWKHEKTEREMRSSIRAS